MFNLQTIKNIYMPLQVGSKAPEFSLYSSSKEKISLTDFTEVQNVLILFFPLAFNGVCTKELCLILYKIH